MNILAIETSCDETAVSVVSAEGHFPRATYTVRANVILSQAKLHARYGGVFPNLAKREHAKNLVPLFRETLTQAKMYAEDEGSQTLDAQTKDKLTKLFEREPELLKQLLIFIPTIKKPLLDAIAVTHGPGLEPALWVGINFAKALSLVWNIPIVPANHMEGHIFSAFVSGDTFILPEVAFPAVALLISGGHTELVVIRDWMRYERVGETRDDAVGEAFDKVARILGLPYPGGPEISRAAAKGAPNSEYKLPRPMIATSDLDFSFSGLKTAVLFMVKKIPNLTEEIKADIAREFETAVTDVLVKKTLEAAKRYGARTIILGGGVTANKTIVKAIRTTAQTLSGVTSVYTPDPKLSGDNAVMIGIAGLTRLFAGETAKPHTIKAHGTLLLS